MKIKYFRKNKDKEEYKQELFEMYNQKVYNTAYAIIHDPHLAQDIVQETFIKIFQQLDHLKEIEKKDSWIKTIAYRTAIDCLRKKKKWESFITNEEYIDTIGQESLINASPVEDLIENKMMVNIIREIILKLPQDDQQILILKYFDKLKDEEIASTLDIPLGTVKSKLNRIIKKAGQSLKNYLEERVGV